MDMLNSLEHEICNLHEYQKTNNGDNFFCLDPKKMYTLFVLIINWWHFKIYDQD